MATKKTPYFHLCTVVRTVLVRHHSMDMTTGATTENVKPAEWVTGPCDTPLFGNDTKTGICRSCRDGWKVPDNYPANEPRPAEPIVPVDFVPPVMDLSDDISDSAGLPSTNQITY